MVWTILIVMTAPSDFMKSTDFKEILDYQGFPLISTTCSTVQTKITKIVKIFYHFFGGKK